jgi:anti-sigma factor RsiW
MSEIDGKALWSRFKAVEPDPLTLAAYAEGRLDGAAAAAVERWLALDPETASDVALARTAPSAADAEAAERVAARASRLVSGRVVPFRARVVRWAEATAIAASFALIAYLGFALGAAQAPLADDTAEVFDSFTVINSLLDGLQA